MVFRRRAAALAAGVVAIAVGACSGGERAGAPRVVAADDLAGQLAQLREGDIYAEERAASALGKIGAPAIPGLRDAQRDQKIQVRDHALVALIAIGGSAALPGIGEALCDMDRMIRERATAALLPYGEAAIPFFATALEHPQHSVRENAALGLGKLGPAAIPPLRAALIDPDGRVRHNALIALGQIGTPAIPVLKEAERDDDRGTRVDATRVLRDLEQREGGPAS